MARASRRAIITLTTDFGTTDHYVASMKGVILSLAPEVTIVDVTHEIGAQDVIHAAFVLRHIWTAFPPETIHVVVVDPTVGTDRRILAARYNGRTVLAPDNGVISIVHHDGQVEGIRVVEQRHLFAESISSTFHGRDIFAPVAARLAAGMPLSEVGSITDHITTFVLPRPTRHADGSIQGEVLYVDGFGNLVTNLTAEDMNDSPTSASRRSVFLRDRRIGTLRRTYAEVARDEPLALIGSTGWLEIAVNSSSAATLLNAGVGAPVFLR